MNFNHILINKINMSRIESKNATIYRGIIARFNIVVLLVLLHQVNSYSQAENLQISHPVYKLLERAEARGFLPNNALNDLPIPRGRVIEALKLIQNNDTLLSSGERSTLEHFLIEFGIEANNSRVLFASSSDTSQILFDGLISDDEKLIYRYSDSVHSVSFLPLASAEIIGRINDEESDKAILGHLGFRLFGTLSSSLGYNLQVTNGSLLNGNKDIALFDHKYSQNIKFAVLNSDIDYTESHIRFQHDWFYAGIGRESRLIGAGYKQRMIISDNPPAFDAIYLGARLKKFEYKFMHSSLLSLPETYFGWQTGPDVLIIPKFMVTHRLSVRPEWGEISFWESIIYSNRFYDLAYLNPLSFLKSLEHSLRDRDNSGMGIDATVRIFDGIQLKGTYFLDDIIFSKIGTGFWGNKSAYNIGLQWSPSMPFDVGFEYTRVEPFTFSHFNVQNSMTHDSYIVSSYLQPNSDIFTLFANYWWGNRYPLEIEISYRRHGRNVLDEDGNIIHNVGGSALQTHNPKDPMEGYLFLDGDVEYLTKLDIKSAYEIVRGFNFKLHYTLYAINSDLNHFIRVVFRFDEF